MFKKTLRPQKSVFAATKKKYDLFKKNKIWLSS